MLLYVNIIFQGWNSLKNKKLQGVQICKVKRREDNNNHFFPISLLSNAGNVWRHSVSVATVMDGFKIDPSYTDFTLPTIDGFHNHILGGSWISLGNLANTSSRYAFRRHFYQYAGIRYVASNNTYHDRYFFRACVQNNCCKISMFSPDRI